MRQLTAYASYLDNEGAPLVGRARFYNLDGSDAVVYSLDNATDEYEEIGSVVFTNSSGQLEPQVFLADHDYLIVFDKYIGAGTMSEDDNSESWEEQGSAVDRYNTLGIVLDGDSVRTIDTIAQLRNTVPAVKLDGEPDVVLLLGYNGAGDKEPIYYKWDETNTDADNQGSTIKVNDVAVGRWVFLECPRYLDVRHFGAFPMQDSIADNAQRYAIQRAGHYAHLNSCGIYFPADELAVYYDVSNLHLYDVDSNPAARVFSKTPNAGDAADSTKGVLDGIVSIHCGGNTQGLVELVNDTVRSSWGEEYQYSILSPTRKLIVDGAINETPVTFSDLEVEIFESPSSTGGVTFDNCKISCFGVLTDPITIANCELKTEWFVDNYDWDDLTSVGNKIYVDNCKNAETYIILKNKQGEADYGDMGHRGIDSSELLDGFAIENAAFNNVVLKGSGMIQGCSGSLTKEQSAAIQNLVIRGSDLVLSPDLYYEFRDVGNIQVYGSQLSGNASTTKISCNSFKSFDSTIDIRVKVSGRLDLKSCAVNYDIEHYSVEDSGTWYINGTMTDCILAASHKLFTDDTGTDTVVNFSWKGNISNAATAVDISDIAGHTKSYQYHSYEYEGNGGTFLPGEINETFSVANANWSTIPGLPSVAGDKAYIIFNGNVTPNAPIGAYVELDHSYQLFTLGFVEYLVEDTHVEFVLTETVASPDNPDVIGYGVSYKKVHSKFDGEVDLSMSKGYYTNFMSDGMMPGSYSVTGARAFVSVKKYRQP